MSFLFRHQWNNLPVSYVIYREMLDLAQCEHISHLRCFSKIRALTSPVVFMILCLLHCGQVERCHAENTQTNRPDLGQTSSTNISTEAELYYKNAFQLYKQRNFQEAAKNYAEAYVRDPQHIGLYNLAHACRAAKQDRYAIQFYDRYLAHQPSGREAILAQRALNSLVTRLDPDVQLSDIRSLRFEQLQSLTVADVYLMLGNPGNAEKFYARFLSLGPPPGPSLRHAKNQLDHCRIMQGKPSLNTQPTRPVWRKAISVAGMIVGAGLLALGTSGLIYDGRCTDGPFMLNPVQDGIMGGTCNQIYDLTALGGATLGAGALVVLGSSIMLAIPPRRPQESRLAVYPQDTQSPTFGSLGFSF